MNSAAAAVLLALVLVPLEGESLRSPFKGEVTPDGPAVSVGLDEMVQVSLPAGLKFARALEIEIAIPREALPYRSSLAVFVYQNFVPGKAATGDRVGLEVLPPAARFFLQAPLTAKAGLKAAVDTAVLKLPRLDAAFPLAVVVLPIDKELPPGYEKFQFSVRTRLVNSNLGSLVVLTPQLSEEDRQRLKLTANGTLLSKTGPTLLEPGPYTVEVTLPGSDPVVLTTVVNQAKTTELTVNLVIEEPTVVIEAPEGTQVVLDGKRLAWKPSTAFPVERGAHTVQFLIGNTVVSDAFTIDKGGRHRLALALSVVLSRD